MGSEGGIVRLAIVLGPAPMRRWERMAIDLARVVAGVELTAILRSANPLAETSTTKRGGGIFRRFVREAKGSSMLAVEGDTLSAEGARSLETARPHVILYLCGAEPNALENALASAGCWHYKGPGDRAPADVPPGTREALTNHMLSHFALHDANTGHRLRHGVFSTVVDAPWTTADRILELASAWPAQALTELVHHGTIARTAPHEHAHTVRTPGDLSMWAYRIKHALTRPRPTLHDNGSGDWNIGLLHQPIETLLDEQASMNVRWFPPPSQGKGRMEPFGYRTVDGELNVLYRKIDGPNDHHTIARLRPKPDNILKRSRTMLDLVSDHAYPYVVMIDGVVHVLRSVRSEDTTELYRINDANDGVDPVTTLLAKALIAPSLFQYQDRWWLCGTSPFIPDGDLHLYHGPLAKGPFQPHALDPVKCDVRSSRPAGTPFVHEGILYRPALDLEDPWHPAVVINKVVALTPDRFEEVPMRRIDGFPSTAYGMGVRTFCSMGEVTLVDGLRSPVLTGTKANGSRNKRRRSSKRSKEV